MAELDQIIKLLENTFNGRAWHGPDFITLIKDVNVNEAKVRLLKGRHTIWEIVDHCTFWIEAVIEGVSGSEMPVLSEVEDWLPMGESEESWEGAVCRLKGAHNNLLTTLSEISIDLSTQVSGRDHTFRDMLYGLVHHNVYHMGQIAILRKTS
jgi:hypothetical protein